MIYTIENEFLRVSANEKGAELFSLYSKQTNVEYLWQGDEAHWKDRALNLFPFIGRMFEGHFLYQGNSYPSRAHGLARYFTFTMEKKTENSLTFLLKDNEETRREYPFTFEFRVSFILDGKVLTTRYEVTNVDNKTLICAFGGHPGINLPFGKGAFEDCYLEFAAPTPVRRHLLADNAPYMADKTVEYPLVDGVKLPLDHELFVNDAIILENTCGEVALKCKGASNYVSMKFHDFKFIGFWQAYADDTPYLCLEPWSALPANNNEVTDIEKKPCVTHVPAGEKAAMAFTLEIHE